MATQKNVHRAHEPVLFAQSLEALAIRPDGVYVDATFGRGGHSLGILERLGSKGRLIALDRDPAAIESGLALQDSRLKLVHSPFSKMAAVVNAHAMQKVDGVLMDLGVSSPQLDEAQRGFSFKQDGPLDMRMDPTQGISAAQWLEQASETEIAKVLRDYGEERAAVQIAKTIIARRGDNSGTPLQTTGQLASLVAGVLRRRQGREGGRTSLGKDPATRTFQAIRIYINQEFEELALGLRAALDVLRSGGRLAVISFHSLEDRIVKQFIGVQSGKLRAQAISAAHTRVHSTFVYDQLQSSNTGKRTLLDLGKWLPTKEECKENPRARSAVLRVAQRVGAEESA